MIDLFNKQRVEQLKKANQNLLGEIWRLKKENETLLEQAKCDSNIIERQKKHISSLLDRPPSCCDDKKKLGPKKRRSK